MPNVEIRLFDLDTNAVVDTADTPGEVQVRGPGITKEYWRLPDATAKEFIDGWFKTGDIAERCGAAGPAHNMYHILGRNSVDIIKSGGEKISAVEIERAILELPDIQDAAVVGVADEEWGQVVSPAFLRVVIRELRRLCRLLPVSSPRARSSRSNNCVTSCVPRSRRSSCPVSSRWWTSSPVTGWVKFKRNKSWSSNSVPVCRKGVPPCDCCYDGRCMFFRAMPKHPRGLNTKG